MTESNRYTRKSSTRVECLEVLISKTLAASSNLFWTLSVYSLENQPVKKDRSAHNSEIFHFMVYDWNRTIQQLLEENKIPYSIIQYFTPDSIYPEALNEVVNSPDNEVEFITALKRLPESGQSGDDVNMLTKSKMDRRADLMAN